MSGSPVLTLRTTPVVKCINQTEDHFRYSSHGPPLPPSTILLAHALLLLHWRDGSLHLKDRMNSAQLSSNTHQEYDLAKLFNLSDPQSVNKMIFLLPKVSMKVRKDEIIFCHNAWHSSSCFSCSQFLRT